MNRARIKRHGKQFVLPWRDNAGDVARDQECLNAVPKNVSVEEVEKAVALIRKQREDEVNSDKEVARGGVEGSSQGETGVEEAEEAAEARAATRARI